MFPRLRVISEYPLGMCSILCKFWNMRLFFKLSSECVPCLFPILRLFSEFPKKMFSTCSQRRSQFFEFPENGLYICMIPSCSPVCEFPKNVFFKCSEKLSLFCEFPKNVGSSMFPAEIFLWVTKEMGSVYVPKGSLSSHSSLKMCSLHITKWWVWSTVVS